MCWPGVTDAAWPPRARPGRHGRRLYIRAPGGLLTTRQLRTVGEVSRRYAQDLVTITGQQFRLPLDQARQRPEVTARLGAAGLTVAGDPDGASPLFVGSPVAGIARDEIVDGTPALREIRDQPAVLAGLPRAFTTTVSGSPRQDVLHEASDVSFSGVRHPDRGPGFDVRVGAGLLAHPARAGRLGAFVTRAEVPAVWASIANAFGDFGYRRLDRRQRLALLLEDTGPTAGGPAGASGFRRLIEREYLHYGLADGPAPPPAGPRDHTGVHPQRDGRYYIGVSPAAEDAAPLTGLTALADLAEAHGSTRVRITPYQKLIVLDVSPGQVESFCGRLDRIGLTARPGLSRHRCP